MQNKEKLLKSLLFALVIVLGSCSGKETVSDAQLYLNEAKQLYANGDYGSAIENLSKIDSLYPKALDQRREAWGLLQDVRKAQNDKTIKQCDSLLAIYQPRLAELKKQFAFVQNKTYQTKGIYIPKNDPSFAGAATSLCSGVIEDGNMYIESVYVGAQRHTRIKLTTGDSQQAETKKETGDGLNYRFGGTETIRFTKMTENGIFEFISKNQKQRIDVILQGAATTKYTISAQSKNTIALSYNLAKTMQQIEIVQIAKYKAISLNNYLDEKKQEPVTVDTTVVE